mmetsp:Transcript_41699/g.72366  ORF Transcript_41699/g.72366 Transcript_41699/m.72366 type:complete len:230 (-) Transcript_41699:212-901(-)
MASWSSSSHILSCFRLSSCRHNASIFFIFAIRSSGDSNLPLSPLLSTSLSARPLASLSESAPSATLFWALRIEPFFAPRFHCLGHELGDSVFQLVFCFAPQFTGFAHENQVLCFLVIRQWFGFFVRLGHSGKEILQAGKNVLCSRSSLQLLAIVSTGSNEVRLGSEKLAYSARQTSHIGIRQMNHVEGMVLHCPAKPSTLQCFLGRSSEILLFFSHPFVWSFLIFIASQ